MDPFVLTMVLTAAALHAGWNMLVKMGGDRLILMGLIDGFSGILCLGLLFFFPLPLAASWPFIAASAVLHAGYKLFLIRAYQHGDMGVVYPIARGLSPVLIAIGAFVFAGEKLTTTQLAAVSAIATAISALTFTNGWKNVPLAALAFAVGTSLFIATYTVVDGIGVRRAGSPHAFYLWMSVIDAVVFTGLVLWRRSGRQLVETAKQNWRPGLAGAVMATGAYWIVVWALSVTPMAPVSALRETSVLFGALLAGFVLKEGQLAVRLAAAAVIACGIVGLQF